MRIEPVAKFILTEPTRYRDTYECAAWYKEIEVQPGEYIMAGTFTKKEWSSWYASKGQLEVVHVALPGIVTGSNFSSYFCGNMIGEGKFDEHVGEEEHYSMRIDAYALAHSILRGENKNIQLLPGFTAREKKFMIIWGKETGEIYSTAGIYKDDEDIERIAEVRLRNFYGSDDKVVEFAHRKEDGTIIASGFYQFSKSSFTAHYKENEKEIFEKIYLVDGDDEIAEKRKESIEEFKRLVGGDNNG